ncbi:PTS sugar transporter subunit IIA [Paenibacillus mucilaginosus]|uniref:PTS system, glucose subfamily, IIA subunit n=1 Tax=Paenibacillus mucilaginosus (strain KNP414) TaxID=1036673 RepID=F8F9Y2_PAEMK|nr:PTS glucose transporter subunit IIA [Paenibacillus mucilaginosus]AEI45180.1 PTS system, glucose subfamily, IIA subunit [Paenibacillus mucilaginosus KNP414]MCG7212927.1 PTS glucose transporter subunit IIA [Paenibacillus mucilaginosus]WDM26659.1 PTS glucose transporter subunit IIA [Paenibacillus mucilaginosus]
MLSKLFGGKNKANVLEIAAPLTGTAVPLSAVPDQAFAEGHMGGGLAVEPEEGRLVAPFDGTVAHLIKSKHAVILEHASGVQVLMHIGINTVGLKGEGFHALVATGDTVKAGQTLIEFDMEAIRAAGYPLITPVVLANQAEAAAELDAVKTGRVQAGEPGMLRVSVKPQ